MTKAKAVSHKNALLFVVLYTTCPEERYCEETRIVLPPAVLLEITYASDQRCARDLACPVVEGYIDEKMECFGENNVARGCVRGPVFAPRCVRTRRVVCMQGHNEIAEDQKADHDGL